MASVNLFEVFTVGYTSYDNDTQSEVVVCYVINPVYQYDWYYLARHVCNLISFQNENIYLII